MMSSNRPIHRLPLLLLSLTITAIISLTNGSAFIPSSSPLFRVVASATMMTAATTTSGTSDHANNPSAARPSNPPLLTDINGDSSSDGNKTPKNQDEDVQHPLQLPEATNDPSIPTIKLGESIRFEEMGPVIINADGTTRRIDNWDQMTKREQEVAWRRIAKRNEERRRVLLEEQQQQKEQQQKE